jgi:hypothetical protein
MQESAVAIASKECRENALRCRELAERAQRSTQAQIFSNLAKQWVRLAIQLERAQIPRDESEQNPNSSKAISRAGFDDAK